MPAALCRRGFSSNRRRRSSLRRLRNGHNDQYQSALTLTLVEGNRTASSCLTSGSGHRPLRRQGTANQATMGAGPLYEFGASRPGTRHIFRHILGTNPRYRGYAAGWHGKYPIPRQPGVAVEDSSDHDRRTGQHRTARNPPDAGRSARRHCRYQIASGYVGSWLRVGIAAFGSADGRRGADQTPA